VTILRVSASLAFYRDGGRTKLGIEGRCRMCLHPRRRKGVRRLTRHHLVPQEWFQARLLPQRLRDAEANMIPLCERCHRDVHTDEWARRMLRKMLGQNEIAFAIQVTGREWFEVEYPGAFRARNSTSVRETLAA
jgi:hypothetical protein